MSSGNSSIALFKAASGQAPDLPDARLDKFNEPAPDWVPLERAPFYYNSNGYIRSVEEWEHYIRTKVEQFIEIDRDFGEHDITDPIEWSIGSAQNRRSLIISALDINLIIEAQTGRFIIEAESEGGIPSPESPRFTTRWPGDFIREPNDLWAKILRKASPGHQYAFQWHRRLAGTLSPSGHELARALIAGAAHMMARKVSILAEFERIFWDQWQYFTLDQPKLGGVSSDYRWWFEPRGAGLLSSATGPLGEKIYSIHIAPGESIKRSEQTAEEKCTEWLVQLVRQYPDRRPAKRDEFCEKAIQKFPGLTKSGFGRCFSRAQDQTGNRTWSKAGRPRKSPRKSHRKK
jgi:hypothetical protein